MARVTLKIAECAVTRSGAMAHCSQQHVQRRQLGPPEVRPGLRMSLRAAPQGCQGSFERRLSVEVGA
ncbi:hypothetical protein SGPA1_31385 [Streptomyces misionensis JCM 4497]